MARSQTLDSILENLPAPTGDRDAPLQVIATNLDASDYLGRLATGRVAVSEGVGAAQSNEG